MSSNFSSQILYKYNFFLKPDKNTPKKNAEMYINTEFLNKIQIRNRPKTEHMDHSSIFFDQIA